jgi:hypothetical protein
VQRKPCPNLSCQKDMWFGQSKRYVIWSVKNFFFSHSKAPKPCPKLFWPKKTCEAKTPLTFSTNLMTLSLERLGLNNVQE